MRISKKNRRRIDDLIVGIWILAGLAGSCFVTMATYKHFAKQHTTRGTITVTAKSGDRLEDLLAKHSQRPNDYMPRLKHEAQELDKSLRNSSKIVPGHEYVLPARGDDGSGR